MKCKSCGRDISFNQKFCAYCGSANIEYIEPTSDRGQVNPHHNDYAKNKDESCIEGEINKDGIILGYSGISVDKNKSYSNMNRFDIGKTLTFENKSAHFTLCIYLFLLKLKIQHALKV